MTEQTEENGEIESKKIETHEDCDDKTFEINTEHGSPTSSVEIGSMSIPLQVALDELYIIQENDADDAPRVGELIDSASEWGDMDSRERLAFKRDVVAFLGNRDEYNLPFLKDVGYEDEEIVVETDEEAKKAPKSLKDIDLTEEGGDQEDAPFMEGDMGSERGAFHLSKESVQMDVEVSTGEIVKAFNLLMKAGGLSIDVPSGFNLHDLEEEDGSVLLKFVEDEGSSSSAKEAEELSEVWDAPSEKTLEDVKNTFTDMSLHIEFGDDS